MATIRHRGPYQFQAEIRRKGFPVLRKTFETDKEARSWAVVEERRLELGHQVIPKHLLEMTLSEALEWYEKNVSAKKAKHQAEAGRISFWKKHYLAERPVYRITGEDLAIYIEERRRVMVVRRGKTKPLSDSTIRLELAVISHLYTLLRKRRRLTDLANPVREIEMPKPSQGRIRRLVGDEETRLLEAAGKVRAGTPWLQYIVKLAILTGMRAGELLSLEWSQVFADQRYIHLAKTKNGEFRDVPLSTAALQLLNEIKELPRKNPDKVFDAWGGGVNLAHEFRKATDMSGIVGLTFHDLRHEAASRAAKKLLPQELAKAFGWKTLQMVMRYYHPTALELANKLDS